MERVGAVVTASSRPLKTGGLMKRLKNDHYRKVRGGKAFLVDIFCATCSRFLLQYQKDGDGQLKRCYLNRIVAPVALAELQSNPGMFDPRVVPPLVCRSCGTVIGAAIRHHDGRIAFRLRQGMFTKRRITG